MPKSFADQCAEYDPAPLLLAKLEAAKVDLDKGEGERRAQFIDVVNAKEKIRAVRVYVDGSAITIERSPLWEPYEREHSSKRGKVNGFTNKSRRRLLLFVSSLRTDVLPLFVTLTYPEWWPSDWKSWKTHLDTFQKRLRRKWPNASAVWKLEPQERGAPHFHLIVWGVPFMPHEWLAQAWYECCGTNDPDHLKAGTSVERARSQRGVMCYAGKKYLGKQCLLPAGWEAVGRFWGVIGRKSLPRSRVMTFEMSAGALHRVRRISRKFLRSRGVQVSKRAFHGGLVIWTQHHLQWARVMDWASRTEVQPLDFSLPIMAQPF